jgi:hypothetical protein
VKCIFPLQPRSMIVHIHSVFIFHKVIIFIPQRQQAAKLAAAVMHEFIKDNDW